jgi:hypothetical protein
MKKLLRPTVLALAGCILGFSAANVQADVTIESSMSVDGAGMMAFANMTGTSKTVISGERARTDSDMKMQSKIVGFFARNAVGPSAEIILLDQDKLYHLNVNKKEYSEMTFEQFRAQMQKAQDQMNSNGQRGQPSAIDQSKCEWLPAKASVNKSGEKAQFAGYDAQRVTITASQPCKDKETGAICEIALVLDEWMAADFAAGTEARKFYGAYATKMGMDPSSSQDASQKAKMFFSQYKGVWTEIETKLQGVKGYPVKNSFTLAMGGDQCKDSNSSQAQSSQSSQSSDNSGSPNSIAGAFAGKLGGLFQKKKDPADAPAAQPAPVGTPVALPPGDIALMTISSQLNSVSNSGAGAEAFAVPADYKKIETKTM